MTIALRARLNAGLAASALLLGSAGVAHAQETDAINDVLVCQRIEDEAARLACFDAAAAQLAVERENGLIGIYQRDIEAVERDAFGFDLPSMPNLSFSLFRGNPDRLDPLDPTSTPERVAGLDTPAPDGNDASEPPAPETVVAAAETSDTQPETRESRGGLLSRFRGRGERTERAPAPDAEPVNGVQVVERSQDGSVERVVLQIDRVRQFGYGRYRFYMTNGQVWVQSRATRINFDENADNFAEIRRAAMDSYMMQINGTGRAIRVRRER